MKFTLSETVTYHRALWDELHQTGIDRKIDAKFWEENNIDPNSVQDRCFACEFKSKNLTCEESCIFDWPGGSCEGSDELLFTQWYSSGEIKDRKKYAALIRDLPLKPKYAEMLGE